MQNEMSEVQKRTAGGDLDYLEKVKVTKVG